MADVANVANAATDVVADVAEEVAGQAMHVAEKSRGLSGRDLSLALGGIFVGTGLGGALSFVWTRRKLETKYQQIADDEIVAMREHFRKRQISRDEKPPLAELARDVAQQRDDIVEQEGYSGDGPPMAVQPPENVVESVEDANESPMLARDEALKERRRQAVERDPQLRNVFEDHPPPDDHWDYQEELRQRSPIKPYIIHIDERQETSYTETTLTYYEVDDVLCNERDEVIDPNQERDKLVGEANLDKFGHGSNDSNVVYVRNDRLELDMEIVKSPNSYAQEVHGFDPPKIVHGDRRRGRIPFDDE